LDTTGAFDNVSWGPLKKQLERIGASLRTLRTVESYLTSRRAHLTLEGRTYQKKLERGCPQGSQLGPTLWKIAMSELLAMPNEENVKVIAYADDIVILVGAARHGTAVKRTKMHIDRVIKWASTYKLSFSQTKTQVLSLKGGVKPGYQIRFGTGQMAPILTATGSVKYLGVVLDPRQSYWDHVQALAEKSKSLYSRLRTLTSANWGISQLTSRVLYRAVFLPRITYTAEV